MIMTDTNTIQAPSKPALLIGAEVWAPIEGQMVREAAAPSLGDLNQLLGGRSSATDAAVEQAVATKMPVLSDIAPGEVVSLAWPVIDREQVTAVAMLYLRMGGGVKAAVEQWTGRPGRSELCLTASRYAGLDRFAKISPHIAFPKGAGLPGISWETGLPQIVEGLGQSPSFMRATGAESEGLDIGFGIPCISGSSLQAVILLLSDTQTPVARGYETWMPTYRGDSLRLARIDGAYLDAPALAKASKNLDVPAGDTWIGRCWATRQPAIVCDSSGAALEREGASDAEFTCGLAIPIIALDDVAAVAVLMW